jgi:O-antigen/teichoic acid export membrane protein
MTKRRTALAAAWTMLSRATGQGSQLLVFLVAARFLSPEEFGVFSLLSAVNILMMRIGQAGWVEFAASWRGEEAADHHAFTLATAGGLTVALLGCLAAALFPLAPDLAAYGPLQLLLSLSVVGTGTSAFWAGILLRRQQGEALAKSIAVSQLIGGAASIGGLMLGHELLALGAGKLVTHLINLGMVAASVRWKPCFRLSSDGRAEIVQYSKSILSSNLIGYTKGYAATLALGLFLGPAAVGLYRAGARVVGSLGEIVGEPARTVCWRTRSNEVDRAADLGSAAAPRAAQAGSPTDLLAFTDDAPARTHASTAHGFASEMADGGDVQRALSASSERFLALVLVLATPVFLGLAATSESVVTVILGEPWRGAAPVVAILSVARLITLPSVLTAPLLSMANRVDKLPALDLVAGAATVLALPVSAPFGLLSTALGQLVAALIGFWIAGRAYARYADVRWLRTIPLSAPSAVASVAMVVVLLAARRWAHGLIDDTRMQLAAELMMGAVVFLPLFTLFGGWRQLSKAIVR